ncbi:MAG: DUF502 domain-containing protein [Methylococcaceae bacterium]|jgi:uncharacterized membrane protein|nr:DUF502 domain-containing protein [Methylococcaceae bacterium]
MKTKLQRLFEYFLIGVLGLLPIVIIVQIVLYIEGFLRDTVLGIYGRYESILIPVLLFGGAVGVVIYIGYLLKQDKAHVLYFLEKIIHRIPLLGTVYRVSQKLLKLFHDDNDNKITDVVFIEYPKPDLWVPAYVTNRMDSMLVVYVPTSPNPTSGFTIMVDESKVIQTQLSIEEVSSFIISLGADLPQSEDVLQLLQRTSNRLGRSTPNGALA